MKDNWIPVTEKLPEPGVYVLCFCNHQNVFNEDIKWMCINIGNKNTRNDDFFVDDTTFVNVTHWMPLPEPPISGTRNPKQ
jgi:Protein of unknown function (DUF551)